MSRYAAMFAKLSAAGEGAFIPFAMLGDPDPAGSRAVLDALIAGGADALELGVPFSDPVADGPVIQAAAVRALAAGTRLGDCWRVVAAVRQDHPALPIGLLTYANIVAHRGLDRFYSEAAEAGVDSVLVADVPVSESGPFRDAAHAAGLEPVFIAPPNADPARLRLIAEQGRGYTYVVTREGVTGTDTTLRRDSSALLAELVRLGAAPGVLGFGIANPEQVRHGLAMGAQGVISGSAVVQRVAAHQDNPEARRAALVDFVRQMKGATSRAG